MPKALQDPFECHRRATKARYLQKSSMHTHQAAVAYPRILGAGCGDGDSSGDWTHHCNGIGEGALRARHPLDEKSLSELRFPRADRGRSGFYVEDRPTADAVTAAGWFKHVKSAPCSAVNDWTPTWLARWIVGPSCSRPCATALPAGGS